MLGTEKAPGFPSRHCEPPRASAPTAAVFGGRRNASVGCPVFWVEHELDGSHAPVFTAALRAALVGVPTAPGGSG